MSNLNLYKSTIYKAIVVHSFNLDCRCLGLIECRRLGILGVAVLVICVSPFWCVAVLTWNHHLVVTLMEFDTSGGHFRRPNCGYLW